MIFADASEDMADVGKSIEIVNLNNEQLLAGLHTFLARQIEQNLIVGFGGYLFKSKSIRTQIKRESQGAKVLGISKGRISDINIYYPENKEEQQKIAACLSSLDELIAANSDKLDALKDHKKGLMQNLFPQEGQKVPNYRFPEFEKDGEWVEKTMKNIAPLQRGFDLPTSELIEGNVPVVYSNGIRNYHNEYKATAPGLVTGRSGTIGKFSFIKEGVYWPHNTSLWVTDFMENNQKFIYYLFNTIDIIQFATGSGVPTLNRNNVHSHVCCIPKLQEQRKIASCLSAVDELITAQSEKIEKFQLNKKGLMQGLFPKIES